MRRITRSTIEVMCRVVIQRRTLFLKMEHILEWCRTGERWRGGHILHNGGQPNREEDYFKRGKVTRHYRFDVSKVDSSVLKKWGE